MEFTLETKQQLEELLSKPSLVGQEHAYLLQNLIKTYPYYQPLHLLLAKASAGTSDQEVNFTNAALYTNGQISHKVIFETPTVKPFENLTVVAYHPLKAKERKLTEELPPLENEDTSKLVDAMTNNFIKEELLAIKESDEQEVFDEITELVTPENQTERKELNEVDNVDNLVVESISNTDFFAFEKNFSSETIVENLSELSEKTEATQTLHQGDDNIVSKYDDDKLPYTFLWWLAKTRKDHEQIFRPYVNTNKPKSVPTGDLQQQYVENIFHIQAPFEPTSENATFLVRKINSKEDDIIDNFIKNEPQIKVPKPEQINNENKAKKSAEDNNDLVSETLAEIYIEQMLYHKAIDTYQKLSLKFPEKSAYFADLIQSLEKKI